ncbi:MAG: methyltransferase domain-containing protein [Spirochaetales bacterium]|nr:methyltransferase domain-containing protein [Spirochaetales bacterium]
MEKSSYIMESCDEVKRLETKTGSSAVQEQACWAGLKPGMRVADIGCGSGKTSSYLKEITGVTGEVLGIDRSSDRISFARENYSGDGISFVERDIYQDLSDLGQFDFIWVRFFLEYHRKSQFDLVEKLSKLLSPEGILCLIDLDHNSMNHYGHSARLKNAIESSIAALEKDADFDPYAGRRLYSHMFDLQLENIDIHVGAHHLIFGELKEGEEFNWLQKVAVAGRDSGYDYPDYPGGFEEFYLDCRKFFQDPRRFTYTPLIICRGSRGADSVNVE